MPHFRHQIARSVTAFTICGDRERLLLKARRREGDTVRPAIKFRMAAARYVEIADDNHQSIKMTA